MKIRVEYRKLKSGNVSPRLVISNKGKRSFEPIKIKIYKNDPERNEKIKACEAIRARREFQFFGDTHGVAIKYELELMQVVSEYIDSLQISSVRKYKASKKIIESHFGNISLYEIQKNDCQKFADLLYSKFSSQTAYSYYACFSRILQSCVERGVISSNPARGIKKKSPTNTKDKEIILFEEFDEMLRHPIENKDVMKAAVLSFYSGAGLSEIYKFNESNIQGNYLKYSRSKNGSLVSVELKKFVIDLVGNMSFEDLPTTTNGVNKAIKSWISKTSINKHITFYCFRHSFAVNLLLNNVGINHVKELMGHSEIKQTLNYVKYADAIRFRPTMNLPDLSIDGVF